MSTVSKTTTQEKARQYMREVLNRHITAELGFEIIEAANFADSLTAELQKEKAETAKALGIHFCPDLEEPWEVPMESEPDYFETLPEAAAFLFKLLDNGLSDREGEIARLELESEALEKENARLREALEKIAFVGSGYTNTAQRAIARAALSKEKAQ